MRGVTYGTFGTADGDQLPPQPVVRADFAAMVVNGVNAVRTYTVPPPWLLDLAENAGLRVLVGIPWEQHTTFLGQRATRQTIERTVRDAVSRCRRHRAVLAYVIGNEIPPSIVRWHGRQRVERFLERLYRIVKSEDPEALVTYANYPSTEYLHLPFLDFVSFNVFLEERVALDDYLARLQTIAGDRPLVITELGLDSARNGREEQARSVGMQVAAAFAAGCAGCCVFAWTDEWSRTGVPVDEWEFGVVDRDRQPKPGLRALRAAYATAPFVEPVEWPRATVVVCTYNGARTIVSCVEALGRQDYPNFETIVVDDGSTDGAGQLAREHGARVIRTLNRGLSAARNAGIAASDGDVVAFCDDDTEADPQWLSYLIAGLVNGPHVGIGGPNVPSSGSIVGDSVGHSPGGPVYVLASPTVAEHLPGCNMAFWRSAIDRVGGFDVQFRQAGDDVDICWRLQTAGGTLGFSPAALVWHQPRQSTVAYVRQQIGYGHAEALLERKWPERYNGRGHVDWRGSVYGGKVRRTFSRRRWHVYYGRSGNSAFQSVYSPRGGADFPLAPEWYLVIAALAVAAFLPLIGQPAVPAIGMLDTPPSVLLLPIGLAALCARAASWTAAVVLPLGLSRHRLWELRALIFVNCLIQPMARLIGRTHLGLTIWRTRGPRDLGPPWPRSVSVWSEEGLTPEEWLQRLEHRLVDGGAQVSRNSGFEPWDLHVQVGAFASALTRIGIEEHGAGRQMVRLKVAPRLRMPPMLCAVALATLTTSAFALGSVVAGGVFGLGLVWLLAKTAHQAAVASKLPIAAVGVLETFDPVSDVAAISVPETRLQVALVTPVRRKLELTHLPELRHANGDRPAKTL